jgi:hypothetical protein
MVKRHGGMSVLNCSYSRQLVGNATVHILFSSLTAEGGAIEGVAASVRSHVYTILRGVIDPE